jgi:anti-sigma factor RsiW
MCDFSGKLIAWLDRELPSDETASVERHLEACAECRSAIESYKRVSCELNAYCDEAVAASSTDSRMPRWIPVAAAAGAVAAFLVLFLAWSQAAGKRHAISFPPPVVTTGTGTMGDTRVVGTPPATSMREVHRGHSAATEPKQSPVVAQAAQPVRDEVTDILAEEPVIRIAIPADEMFPPGAVPEGIRFAADLTIAADGSAERLRLRPRLAGFERRTTQP